MSAPTIMERTRAAVVWHGAGSGRGFSAERSKMFSFLTIFHPKMSLQQRIKMVDEAYPYNSK